MFKDEAEKKRRNAHAEIRRSRIRTERSNAKSQATDAALSRQVACTDGLGAAVPPAPTFGGTGK